MTLRESYSFMTISLPGSSRKGLTGLFKRKQKTDAAKPAAKKQLDPTQVAKLFDKDARTLRAAKPAKLSESEKHAREQLSSLRGALYSKD